MVGSSCPRVCREALGDKKKTSPLTLGRGSGKAWMEIRGEVRLRATSQPIVHPKFTRFLPNELLCDANRVLLSCRCAFRSGLFARGFRRGTAGGMLAFARCDKAKHSRAVARLSIAVGRRLQARTTLPEAGRPRRKASRPVATWRPVDLTTWTKSADRQVDKSKGRRREGSEGP